MAGEGDLAGEFGEHPVVFIGEGVGGRRPFDDDEPEELAGVADRRHPQLALPAPVEQHGQPHGCPGVAGHARPGNDRPLPGRDHDRPWPGIRDRRCPLQHVPGASEHLGTGQAHGLAQRLGQLQQQLIHRDRPGQPAAEGSQHFIGRLPGAEDEPGSPVDEPVPGRDVPDGRDRGREHRQPEHLAVGRTARRPAETENHDHVDGGDRDGEAGHG